MGERENALGQPHVDTQVRLVHQLGHRDVPGHTHQLIRLVAAELFLRDQKIDQSKTPASR